VARAREAAVPSLIERVRIAAGSREAPGVCKNDDDDDVHFVPRLRADRHSRLAQRGHVPFVRVTPDEKPESLANRIVKAMGGPEPDIALEYTSAESSIGGRN
jgi:hypothetical protein